MTSVYKPPFIKQLDGSAFGGANCTLASLSMAIVRDLKGKNPPGSAPWYPTPRWLRAVSGDHSGGTTLTQADALSNKYYGVNIDVKKGIEWSEFRKRIEAGKGAILQGRYKAFHGTAFDACPTFTGNHAVYINELRWSQKRKRWEYLMYDPLADGRRNLPKGPMWIGESQLKTFAGTLILGRTATVGIGKAWAGFTKDTEGVILRYGASLYGPKTFTARFDGANVRRAPQLDGLKVDTLKKGETFKAFQKKSDGPSVDGSRVWYGDSLGTKWIAAKNLNA